MQPVELQEIVHHCWGIVATARAEIQLHDNPTVIADRRRFQQLLENLVRNSIDHGGEDVVVTIGLLDEGIFVEDTGPGIPKSERDDVFTAGYSRTTHGTGFGLSIVKQVVDAHGWHIDITDAQNGGARFEITEMTIES